MADAWMLPRSLLILRNDLPPVWAQLQGALVRGPQPPVPVHDWRAAMAWHLHALQGRIDGLQACVQALDDCSEARAAPVPDGQVRQAVQALHAWVRGMVALYAEVRAWSVPTPVVQGRDLLAAVYRSLLEDVERWLHRLLAFLRAPQALARQQQEAGLPLDAIPMALVLRPMAALGPLRAWRQAQAGGDPQPTARSHVVRATIGWRW